nr:MAG TPA: hypothetical protein [Caudoviricetes sp.]
MCRRNQRARRGVRARLVVGRRCLVSVASNLFPP